MKTTATILLILLSLRIYSQEYKRYELTSYLGYPTSELRTGCITIDNSYVEGFSIKNNSYNFGLSLSSLLNEKSQLRLRTGFTRINKSYSGSFLIGSVMDSVRIDGKQNKFHLAPGIIWNIKIDKIKFYFGFEIPVTFYSSYNFDTYLKTFISNLPTSEEKHNYSRPIAFSVGLGSIFGFNYFLKKQLSIGAEFSPSILYYSLGGQTIILELNSITRYFTSDRFDGRFGLDNRLNINLTFHFKDKI